MSMNPIEDLADGVDTALNPQRTASIALKLAFGILLVPVVVGAFLMSKTVIQAIDRPAPKTLADKPVLEAEVAQLTQDREVVGAVR